MIETVGELMKSLHQYGSGKPVLFMHHGETIQILTLSGATDGSVILMSTEAASIDKKSPPKSSNPDVIDAIEQCDHILTLCDEVDSDSRGADFVAEIEEKVQGVRDWIEENDYVTDKQLSALAGWERGVEKWIK